MEELTQASPPPHHHSHFSLMLTLTFTLTPLQAVERNVVVEGLAKFVILGGFELETTAPKKEGTDDDADQGPPPALSQQHYDACMDHLNEALRMGEEQEALLRQMKMESEAAL